MGRTMPETLDMQGRYAVAGYGGIAFYLLGYATEWTPEVWTYLGDEEDQDAGSDDYYERTGYRFPDENPANYTYDEPEEVEDRTRVRAVMVGDDRVFIVDIEDLSPLEDDDYCPECGQIGCRAYAWSDES